MKKFALGLMVVAAFVAGVAMGRYAMSSEKATDAVSDEVEPRARRISTADESERVASLRARIRVLERALSERPPANDAPTETSVAEALDRPNEGRRRGGMREMIERMKSEDPARYAEMTNRVAQWRSQRLSRAQNRIDFLSAIDTSGMSADAKATHEHLTNAIARREEIEEQLRDENLTDEARGALFHEMHEISREMVRLGRDERANLIRQAASNLGFAGEDVEEIATTIEGIVDVTGEESGWGRGHGGIRGRGMGGPGRRR